MSAQVRTTVIRSFFFVMVSILAIVSCDKIFPTETGPVCDAGRFKCEDPGLKASGALACGQTCQCILDNTQFVGTSVVYVCMLPNGTLANYVSDRLEDVSDYESRNHLTCISKIRCTRS